MNPLNKRLANNTTVLFVICKTDMFNVTLQELHISTKQTSYFPYDIKNISLGLNIKLIARFPLVFAKTGNKSTDFFYFVAMRQFSCFKHSLYMVF